MRALNLILVVFILLAAPAMADTPIGAKAVYVRGDVSVTAKADGKTYKVDKGATFAAGDRLVTSANGVVEVQFDTGNLIRLDKGSDLVIKNLHRNERGSTFSIFGLTLGRVKSAVSKLASSESKFEYHTKAAIAGVAGTPDWVVEVIGDTTNVDLLGEEGEPGQVYVLGGDKKVFLSAQFRTTITYGLPPVDPFKIDPNRLQILRMDIPFQSRIESPHLVTTMAEQIVVDNIRRRISIPPVVTPDNSRSLEELERHYDVGGTGGGSQGGGGGQAAPGLNPVTIRININ
ncbi:MAG: FecR domain-containing protein [Nitrospinae bacterium]|nr:FecR domain-containing protein [Nitrospinota bacterium]